MKIKLIWYIIFGILILAGIWAAVSFSGSYLSKTSENSQKDVVLKIGIEDQISKEVVPLVNKFFKKEHTKINISLTNSIDADPFDIFISSKECASGCEKVGELASDKIIFANFEDQNAAGIFLNFKNRYSELSSFRDFLKSQLSSGSTTIVAVGDIMLSRNVGAKIFAANDFRLPFLQTQELTATADIAFANLESPFYNVGPRVTSGMVFKAEPETVEGLVYASIDMVSLANNHFGNQGRAGMEYTFKHLTDNGIAYTGAGENFQAAHEAKVIKKNGIRFGFLGYTGGPSPTSSKAGDNIAGYALINTTQLKKDIIAAKEKSDVVIVSMHDGVEYTPDPNTDQIDFAHAAIDNGAILVIGHHPHVVQAIERYKNGLILYSLGNFVFDQMWSEETREGAAAKIIFDKDRLASFELIPIKIFDYNQPRIVEDQALKDSILDRIINASNKLNKEQII